MSERVSSPLQDSSVMDSVGSKDGNHEMSTNNNEHKLSDSKHNDSAKCATEQLSNGNLPQASQHESQSKYAESEPESRNSQKCETKNNDTASTSEHLVDESRLPSSGEHSVTIGEEEADKSGKPETDNTVILDNAQKKSESVESASTASMETGSGEPIAASAGATPLASTDTEASTDTQALSPVPMPRKKRPSNDSASNEENRTTSEADPSQLRNHRQHVVARNHASVLSCPDVINIASAESEQGNRRHSMDIFDLRNRVKKKKGNYKRTDISGPICTAGKGFSSTMRTRPIRTANSESNLLENIRVSSLTASLTEFTLNKEDQPPMIITWDITSSISSWDCISLYLRKEDQVPELVSFRNAGVGYMRKGEIDWDLNHHQEKFTSEENFVVFKYYHPTATGGLSLVAASQQVTVYNTRPSSSGESMRSIIPAPLTSNADITVLDLSDLCGYNLKRGVFFNPDPYVKISVFPGPRCVKQPHHKQLYRTKQAGNTINPVWKERFLVQVLPTDFVELEVKDRFDRSRPILRRFLGRLLIPVQKLQEVIGQGDERFSEALGKRTPIDQTSGSLSFLITSARNGTSMRSSVSLTNVPSTRGSRRSSEPPASNEQTPAEDDNYSSDASSANSEQRDITAPEYVPTATHELSNGSATILSEVSEPPIEPEVSTQEHQEKISENPITEAQESQSDTPTSSQPSSTIELAEDRTNKDMSGDIVDGGVIKNAAVSALIESSPSPIQSPKERSPMRKNRLGAVSFFPDDNPNTSQNMVTSFSKRKVSSLRNISVAVVSKTAEQSENNQAATNSKSTVPSLMRLSSVELQRAYGAVGGVQSNSPQTESVTIESPKPMPSLLQNNDTEIIEENPTTSKEIPQQKPSTSAEDGHASLTANDSSPVNEVLSITIHRTGEEPLGLSIVGGSNSSKANAKHICVKRVEAGSPAAEAGVKVSDRILAVNSESMVNIHHNTAVAMIRNSGVEVVMQVERKLNASTKRRYSKNNGPILKVTDSDGDSMPSAKRKSGAVVADGRKGTSPPPRISVTSGAVKLPSAFDARFRASRHRIMSRTDITPENEIPTQEGLPPNWEAFRDRHGRIYYVDHDNRSTQWNHPTLSPTPNGEPARGVESDVITGMQLVPGAATLRRRNSTEGDRNYESAMKRYQSIKRAMKRQSRTIGEEEEGETSFRAVTADEATHGIHSPGGTDEDSEEALSPKGTVAVDSAIPEDTVDSAATGSGAAPAKDNAQLSPGCQFLIHPQFRDLLVQNAEAHSLYQSNSILKYIKTKVSKDPTHFKQYQHNKELVKFINMFANSSQDLPQGWETRKDLTGKAFFIDHNLKLTTFIDPRLPLIYEAAPEVESSAPSSGDMPRDLARAPVQSPLVSEQPPPVPPRPERTLTEQSRRVEGTSFHSTNTPEPTVQEMPTAYNEKVVAFLQQPNIVEILKARHPEVGTSDSLRERVMLIRTEGVTALERMSYSVNLTLMLSKFEDEIMNFVPKNTNTQSVFHEQMSRNRNSTPQGSPVPTSNDITKAITRSRAPAPYKRDFESKLHNFYRKLDSKGYGKGPNKIKMQVRRDHLLEDAFQKVKSLTRKELQRSKLNISFIGEEGLDYSGPSREFFFLVSRELFNPYYGLFEYSAVDTYTVQISPMSAFIDDPMEWFRFAGRIIGLALIHHYLLDAFFTRPLYKALLRAKCDISDLQYIDEQFYNSIMWMKDHDITDVLDLNFTADEEVFGQIVEKELKPNGKNIVVTEKNKKDYIERMVKWRVNRSCREQTNQIVRGFNEVIDLRLVSVFDARELELVLCGTAEIDLNDWRQNTEYRGGYHDLHPVIQWFWEALEKFDNERRLRLLQFVTGTSSIPYEGFSALRGPNGPKKFCIEKWGKAHFLPRAHTCFNRVDLPPYPTFQVLWEKLTIAVEETSTFGIE